MQNKSLLYSSRFVTSKVKNEILLVAAVTLVENRSKFNTEVLSFLMPHLVHQSYIYLEQFLSTISIVPLTIAHNHY